jgi:hypothetical protein
MKPRAFLIVALLASPAWSQQPAFDPRSDAVKKVVHDAAASQDADARPTPETPADGERREAEYVPPDEPLEELPVLGREPASQAPAPAPAPAKKSDGILSTMFEFLLEEALHVDEYDDVSNSNDMLRCRVQKEQKSSPPGIDNCPTAE